MKGCLILVLVGSVFLGTAIWLVNSERNFARGALQASGVVTAVEQSGSFDSRTYYPRVRYTTNTGQQVEFRGDVGGKPSPYHVGQTVALLYHPDAPTHAHLRSPIKGILVWVMGGVGVLCLLMSIFQLARGG